MTILSLAQHFIIGFVPLAFLFMIISMLCNFVYYLFESPIKETLKSLFLLLSLIAMTIGVGYLVERFL